MPSTAARRASGVEFSCIPVSPARHVPDLEADVRAGLLDPPRSLPPKYFYDAHGAELFERICETREYYPTRTEDQLLARHATDIITSTRPDQIVELGSGSSRKTRRLFDACVKCGHRLMYAPFDVCEPMLEQAAAELAEEYPWLDVQPLSGDYNAGLKHFPPASGRRLFVFLGGTLGNFPPDEAREFIKEIAGSMRAGDALLVGVDRIKDPDVLHAAYNDGGGVTAEFNLNVLRVLNRELNANFDINRFEHEAVFNPELGRIEMYLTTECGQEVRIGRIDATINIAPGERILTELSYKFATGELEDLLGSGGFQINRHFQPPNKYFSLALASLI